MPCATDVVKSLLIAVRILNPQVIGLHAPSFRTFFTQAKAQGEIEFASLAYAASLGSGLRLRRKDKEELHVHT